MEYKNFLIKKEENISIIYFNRPNSLNALNSDVLKELNMIIENITNDNSVDVIIITGNGKAFVAGADISEMKDMNSNEARDFAKLGLDVFRKIELLNKPVIAAINGYALGGGCELLLSCDIKIASDKAKFGQPEVGLGITPGFGGTQRLARLVGLNKAKELIFTGDIIDSNEALRIGLVNRVVEHDLLIEESIKLAKKISKNAQIAVRFAKEAINYGYETDLETALNIEKNLFSLCFSTKDQKEGMSAFLEKRKPEFKSE